MQRHSLSSVNKNSATNDLNIEPYYFVCKIGNVELIYKALEIIYDPEQTPENVWQPVFQSTQDKTRAIQLAEETAKEARMAVALLKETVADAIKNDRSIETPDLITLDENVARALYR